MTQSSCFYHFRPIFVSSDSCAGLTGRAVDIAGGFVLSRQIELRFLRFRWKCSVFGIFNRTHGVASAERIATEG